MLIHQAVFGPLRGHAFLRGSNDSIEELFRSTAWATDLPQTAPSGVAWAGFFRLIRLDEQLLLIYTKPFDSASRTGMVLSRAAYMPLAMVEQLHDVRPIARVLQMGWTENDIVSPIDFDTSANIAQVKEPPVLAVQIAAALIRGSKRPLVVFGQEGFDEAMIDLWARVPPEFRSQLTFGLSFGQEDVRNLSVVCTPYELAGRWDAALQIDRHEQGSVCSVTATLLDVPIDASIRSFAKELQFSLNSPASITIALRASQLWSNRAGPADAINLLRILAERAGSGPKASAIKSVVVDELASSGSEWTGQDVLSMRNLELTGVPGVSKFSGVLKSWASSLPSRATALDIGDILQSWATEKTTPLWQSAIGNGFESAFANKATTDSLFTALWHAMAKVPELAGRLLSLLASAKAPEKHLLAAAPRSIELTIADILLPEFVSRGWWEVAGMLLAFSRPATDALMTALKLNAKAAKKALLANALSAASDHEIVAAAVSSQDAIAIQIAVDACIRTSDVMKAFDWTNQVWFQLLGEVASKSEDIIEALPNLLAGMGQTINAQLADKSVWRVVATTRLADLMDVPGRERAWSLIPAAYAAPIGAATAKSWLLRFEEGNAALSQLEPELAIAVQSAVAVRGYLVQVLRRAPAALPHYLRDFGFVSEHEAQSFLAEIQNSDCILSELVAAALGRIINESHWTQTARDAARSLNQRPDFRPMMKECLTLLGFVDRLWVSWALGMPANLSPDEAWSAFESETTTLYPWGPSERELWSRSGGHNEDLANEDNGRATWHRCIRELRAGKAPGTEALLKVMLEDFPYNDTLRQLQRQDFWK